jgi:hypothetical protein
MHLDVCFHPTSALSVTTLKATIGYIGSDNFPFTDVDDAKASSTLS